MTNNIINNFNIDEMEYLTKKEWIKKYQEHNNLLNNIKENMIINDNIINDKNLMESYYSQLNILNIKITDILKHINNELQNLRNKFIINDQISSPINIDVILQISISDITTINEEYKKEIDILKKFKNLIIELEYEIKYLIIKTIISDDELINISVSGDVLAKHKRLDKEGKALSKFGLDPIREHNFYSIFTNFSIFTNIENKEINEKLRIIINSLSKNKTLNYEEEKKINEKYLEIKTQNQKKNFKTNIKNIFIKNDILIENGFTLLNFFNVREIFDNYLKVFNENGCLILGILNRIIKIGYKNVIIIVKEININIEYNIEITSTYKINVRYISLNNFIAETRFHLYAEKLEESYEYKLLMKKYEIEIEKVAAALQQLEERQKLEKSESESESESLKKFYKDSMEAKINKRIIKKAKLNLTLNISSLKQKNLNKINNLYKNSLIIFQKMKWNDIVLKYKENGIIISSGMNNKKSLVSNLEYKLSQMLKSLFFWKSENFIYDILVNSSDNLKDETYKTSLIKKKKIEIVPFDLNEYTKPITYKLLLKHEKSELDGSNTLYVIDVTNSCSCPVGATTTTKEEDKEAEKKKNNKLDNKHKLNANFNVNNPRNYHTSCSTRPCNTFAPAGRAAGDPFGVSKASFVKKNSSEAAKKNIRRYSVAILNKEISNNEFLIYLSKIINDKLLSKEDKQLKIETIWNEIEIKNVENNNNIFIIKNKYLLKAKKTLELKYENNTLKKKFPNFYEKLNSIQILMITFTISLTHISRKKNGWTNTIIKIGEKIFFHLYNQEILKRIKEKKIKKIDINILYQTQAEYTWEDFLSKFSVLKCYVYHCAKLGDFFLEMLCSEPHVIFERFIEQPDEEIDMAYEKAKYRFKISSNIKEYILKDIYIDPASIPMVCKPKIWSNETDGGNIIKDFRNNIITGNKHHGHKMENKEILYNIINNLNQMEFKINIDLLNFLNSDKGKILIFSVLPKNPSFSEKILFFTTLKLAEIFSNESFYLPLNADFRGRIYVSSFFLNYQGSELAKALIYLNKGKTLTANGKYNLYIYGANLYNTSLNKENYENRFNWVTQNLSKIYNLEIDFISKAENIWLFTSFCLIMKNLKEDPNCVVHFPIYIDATCSGIQHIAAMIKDTELGKNVNLIKQNKEDKVKDIYSNLLTKINKAISIEGNDINSNFPILKHVKLDRSNVKYPIMTKTYNVSIIGIKNQLTFSLKNKNISEINIERDKQVKKIKTLEDITINILSSIDNSIVTLENKDIFKLAQIIETSIFSNFPLLKLVYNFLKDTCKVLNTLGLAVIWMTPSGLNITQKYYKSFDNKIALSFAGKTKKLIIKEWTQDLDKRAQVNAIIPNIVHSFDASHLMEVIKICISSDIDHVLPIHDCFGSHPNNLNLLFDILKREFINIYSKEEFLTNYQSFVELYIINNGFKVIKDKDKDNNIIRYVFNNKKKFKLPDAPKTGDLILDDILDSVYMFN